MLKENKAIGDMPIVFVLGAGRSGTNLLAEIINAEPIYYNAQESRYIWNYRQKTLSHDVRTHQDATPEIVHFIRSYFARQAKRWGAIPVDKSPSNVFRVSFLKAVFPNAKILHIIRDGRSNVYSRLREWYGGKGLVESQAADGSINLNSGYRIKLARHRLQRALEMVSSGSLPPSRVPVFLLDNIVPFAQQLWSKKTVRYGERFPGMSSHLMAYAAIPTAGAQWREGVMQALTVGRRLDSNQYLEVRYENLLGNPNGSWTEIAAFLEVDANGPGHAYIRANLRPNSAPNWRESRHAKFLSEVEASIRPTCEFLGYAWQD